MTAITVLLVGFIVFSGVVVGFARAAINKERKKNSFLRRVENSDEGVVILSPAGNNAHDSLMISKFIIENTKIGKEIKAIIDSWDSNFNGLTSLTFFIDEMEKDLKKCRHEERQIRLSLNRYDYPRYYSSKSTEKHKLKKIQLKIRNLEKNIEFAYSIDSAMDKSLRKNFHIVEVDKEVLSQYVKLDKRDSDFEVVNGRIVIMKNKSLSDRLLIVEKKLSKLYEDKKNYLDGLKMKGNADEEVMGLFNSQISKVDDEISEIKENICERFENTVEGKSVEEYDRFVELDNEHTLKTMRSLLANGD